MNADWIKNKDIFSVLGMKQDENTKNDVIGVTKKTIVKRSKLRWYGH